MGEEARKGGEGAEGGVVNSRRWAGAVSEGGAGGGALDHRSSNNPALSYRLPTTRYIHIHTPLLLLEWLPDYLEPEWSNPSNHRYIHHSGSKPINNNYTVARLYSYVPLYWSGNGQSGATGEAALTGALSSLCSR